MTVPSIYINLEDDVVKILARLKHNRATQVVLVCPKRCFLFSNPDNLKVLKQETDALGKEVFVLTMDERGQEYAQEAGFKLKFLPKAGGAAAFSDVKFAKKDVPTVLNNPIEKPAAVEQEPKIVKRLLKKTSPSAVSQHIAEPENYIEAKAMPAPKIKVTDAIFPTEVYNPEQSVNKTKTPVTKIITGVVAISLVIILLLVFIILPSASVIVYARTEPVTRDMEISMTQAVTTLDATKLIIPGTKIDESATVNDSFQSQGKQEVGNKATGTVKIYNFTKLPLNLKAATTKFNVGSKAYDLVSDVESLKPTVYKNAKTKEVDPASLGDSQELIAEQGGEDFNIPAGTRLEITNQVLGSKPQLVYAVTDSEISGGTTRYLSVITQDDVTAAQSQLQSEALEQINSKLKANGLILADKAFTLQIAQFTTDNPVGTQTPTFHATMQIKVSGLAYKQSDLDNLITQRITDTLSANKTLQPKQTDAINVIVKTFDPTNEVAVLDVHYEGQAVYDLDLPDISTQLIGKSKDQANEILRSKAEIDRVEMTLAPIWQKNFPLFGSKINVTVAKP